MVERARVAVEAKEAYEFAPRAARERGRGGRIGVDSFDTKHSCI